MLTSLKFNDDITDVDFCAGRYVVYIHGARKFETDKGFRIKIANKVTQEEVGINEYRFKITDFDGVRYFHFEIPRNAIYEVSILNYKNIIAKRAQLLITGLLLPKININKLRILIQQQKLSS
jgi:hypothetical protein